MGAGTERIFLYGTLRRGGTRDVLRHYGGAEFIGEARVRGVLHDFLDYPGLRLSADDVWVRGELFAVTAETLARLDEWEGIDPATPDDGDYRRVRLIVELDGAPQECWGYEARLEKVADRPVIESGDWIAHSSQR
ncbi:MAG: gamma-glutamylcyclotransferase family protein [Chthoniobacterales bacterium]